MGCARSCVKRQSQSGEGHGNASTSASASGPNQQRPGTSAVDGPSPRRIVVSQNGRRIIRTVRNLQSGDSIIITYPRTDLKTLILDTLRSLRRLVAK